MGSIGWTEILIIAFLLVLLFADCRLGEAGRGIGEAIRNFREGMKGGSDSTKPGGDTGRGGSDR